MKYKLKDSYKGIYNQQFQKNEIIDSNNEFTGIVIEVLFTDTRFFEPVKTRKFEVEVHESDMHIFTAYVEQHDRFSVKEITEETLPYWVHDFKSQNPEVTIDSFEGIDPVLFKKTFIGRRLEGLKWIRVHTDCGFVSAKRLAEYIFDTFD